MTKRMPTSDTGSLWQPITTSRQSVAEKQYREWGASEIRWIDHDELMLPIGGTWSDTRRPRMAPVGGANSCAALCRMPDGRWYYAHGGNWMNLREGIDAKTPDQALAQYVLACARRGFEATGRAHEEAKEQYAEAERRALLAVGT